ncbi:hypothetical protein [Mycoplasma sp. Ms02]|uniref:hypothetical protein n=1 Tax=Mycoplasma sp. Ms02 TaxID=353851 RepID=UPI001C88EDFA|nr:hypothetical protein [Mycoplasma sp. Ms02]QZE12165.1 hypothetical protein K4L35_02355 [Mycoplasma sp. Ms02]
MILIYLFIPTFFFISFIAFSAVPKRVEFIYWSVKILGRFEKQKDKYFISQELIEGAKIFYSNSRKQISKISLIVMMLNLFLVFLTLSTLFFVEATYNNTFLY